MLLLLATTKAAEKAGHPHTFWTVCWSRNSILVKSLLRLLSVCFKDHLVLYRYRAVQVSLRLA